MCRAEPSMRRSLLSVLVVLLVPHVAGRFAETHVSELGREKRADSVQHLKAMALHQNAAPAGRAPSCGGCARRESVLASTMHLSTYGNALASTGSFTICALILLITVVLGLCARRFIPGHAMVTLVYVVLYLIASPTAILVNKTLMKDYGFGYPVIVSALGQGATGICAAVAVRLGYVDISTGQSVERKSLIYLGGASALSLVLGQYPYLYLTVAFIQMLKAFSPACESTH